MECGVQHIHSTFSKQIHNQITIKNGNSYCKLLGIAANFRVTLHSIAWCCCCFISNAHYLIWICNWFHRLCLIIKSVLKWWGHFVNAWKHQYETISAHRKNSIFIQSTNNFILFLSFDLNQLPTTIPISSVPFKYIWRKICVFIP